MATKPKRSVVAKRKHLVTALAKAAGTELPFLCIIQDANRNVEFVAAAKNLDVLDENVLRLSEATID